MADYTQKTAKVNAYGDDYSDGWRDYGYVYYNTIASHRFLSLRSSRHTRDVQRDADFCDQIGDFGFWNWDFEFV